MNFFSLQIRFAFEQNQLPRFRSQVHKWKPQEKKNATKKKKTVET